MAVAILARAVQTLRHQTPVLVCYHPQTDGLSERTIRTVVDTLRCCLNGTHETWDEHLDAIELAVNSSVSATTGLAPFEVLYGENVRLPLTLPAATDAC